METTDRGKCCKFKTAIVGVGDVTTCGTRYAPPVDDATAILDALFQVLYFEQKGPDAAAIRRMNADIRQNVRDQRAAGVDIDLTKTAPPPLRCIPWFCLYPLGFTRRYRKVLSRP